MAVGNLEFITSVSLSSATTLDVTNVFSSEYNVYQINIAKAYLDSTGAGGSQRQQYMRFFDSGGTIIDQTEYDYAVLDMRSDAAFVETRNTSQNAILVVMQIDNSPKSGGATLYVHNPNDSSSYTFTQWQSAGLTNTPYLRGYKGIGVHKSAETISGFRIFNDAAVNWNAECSVYGVK